MARKKHHVEHPDERWLLTYADMITLLMALFMVLFAMSLVDQTKFNELKVTLKDSFSSPILNGGSSILDSGAAKSSQTAAKSELTGKDTPLPTPSAPSSSSTEADRKAKEAHQARVRAAEATQDRQLQQA